MEVKQLSSHRYYLYAFRGNYPLGGQSDIVATFENAEQFKELFESDNYEKINAIKDIAGKGNLELFDNQTRELFISLPTYFPEFLEDVEEILTGRK